MTEPIKPWTAPGDPCCPICGGPVNYYRQCLAEIWSLRRGH